MELVQVLCQTSGVVLRDGEDDGFARWDLLTRREVLVRLARESVELLYHQAVRPLVRPLPLERRGIVVLLVGVRALGDELGDACRESVWNEVPFLKGTLDRIRKV